MREQPLTARQAAAASLAQALANAGDISGCLRTLLELLVELPGHAPLHLSAGRAYRRLRRPDRAAEMFARALALDPCSEVAHRELAPTLMWLGRFDEALACYEGWRALAPSDPLPNAGIAEVHAVRGEHDVALRLVEPWLAHEPVPAPFASLFAALSRRVDRAEEGLAVITRALEHFPGPAFQSRGYYVRGALLEHLGQYDQAFAAYAKGNGISTRTWDADAHRDRTDATIASWTREAIEARADGADASDLALLVVGVPRSGTSLVEQILSCHARVHGAGELLDLPRLVTRRLGAPPLNGMCLLPPLDQVAQEDVRASREEYLAVLRERGQDCNRVIDKLPTNAHLLGLVQLMLPQSRVIHVRRDGLDCGVSCYCTHFTGELNFAFDLEHIGRYHRDVERLMAHWRAALDLRVLEVRYEELVEDLEGQARRMVDFLDLQWDPACLSFHENPRITLTASRDQVREPIYRSSIGRHRHFAEQLGPLRDALAPVERDADAKPL